ncbi:preprotein translocase subunit SecE [Patescibacteria group bacterium]|nr:preprotein translocase subunit SecE [Patescibacteria group bacterium]
MKKIVKFVKEALQELSKVTWPTRPTVIRLTIGVILVSLLFAAFIGLADLGLSNGLRGLLGLIGKTSTSQQGGVSSEPIQINPGDIQVDTTPEQ